MAMGGLMKVHHHGHGHGNRGKPCGLMILLAFGAAVIGVLVLHKVRERRVFNLLVKERDRELTNLQLLLQKEREIAREAKWKLEEMKTKVHTLRAQKRGLDSKIVEMQSTILSLREEQRTIELALEEKQNEIKQMRERHSEASNDNPQVIALSEKLRQKEFEVEELKNRLQPPVKVWSVSTDDPSSGNINLQTKSSVTGRDDTKAIEEKDTSAGLQESTNHEAGKNSTELSDGGREPADISNEEYKTEGEDKRKNEGETIDSRGKIIEQIDKLDDPKERVSEHGNTNLEERNAEDEGKNADESQTEEASTEQEKKKTPQLQVVEHYNKDSQRHRDETNEGYSTEDKSRQTTEDGLQGRTSNMQGAENQESGMKHEGGMKLEMSNHSHIGRKRLEGKGYLRKTKRKKLNKIHKTRKNIGSSERNGAAATNNKSLVEGTTKDQMDNNSGSEDHENKIVDKLSNDEFSEQEMSEQRTEHGEEQKNLDWKKVETRRQESNDISQGIEMLRHNEDEKSQPVNYSSKTTEISLDIPTNMTLHAKDEMLSETKQQNKLEPETSGNQATPDRQSEEKIVAHNKDEISEQIDNASNNEEPENSQMEDATKTEAETEASRESASYSKVDGNSYDERPEEPEF